jgi:two-component system, sensor histidine kinase and response regulator
VSLDGTYRTRRVPLNIIKGLADCTLDTLKISAHQDVDGSDMALVSRQSLLTAVSDLHTLVSTCTFAEHIVGDVSVIRSLEADTFKLNPTLCYMSDVMRELKAALHLKTDDKQHITMNYSFDATCAFRADPVRLKQILLNYTSNALKFTDKGQVTISARVTACSTAILFSVKDTGIGIKEADRCLIFSTVAQASSSTAGRHNSSGLGLYLVSLLAERMGGSVGYTSVPNAGSTFWFRMPHVR